MFTLVYSTAEWFQFEPICFPRAILCVNFSFPVRIIDSLPLPRARLAGFVVSFQAVWRGCCARGKTAPALAARRREVEERKLMFQEEQLAENVVALEAQRREVEAKIQSQELTAMRWDIHLAVRRESSIVRTPASLSLRACSWSDPLTLRGKMWRNVFAFRNCIKSANFLFCLLCMHASQPYRCEEKRTRDAWMLLRSLEETARGEELVRMRAEERCTRALLDLELQDLRRVERRQCEREETIKMQSEDQAMGDLARLERAQILEREAMGAEDELARSWKAIEQ